MEKSKLQLVKDTNFQVVERKKSKRDRDNKNIEGLKAKLPEKSFILSVGLNGTAEARKNLWPEIVKKINAPKVKGTYVLPRGDLLIKLADEKTYETLREIQRGAAFRLGRRVRGGPESSFMM